MNSVVKSGSNLLLRIDADPQVQGSVVRHLADSFLEDYLKIYPQTEIFLRDLALSPHLGLDVEEKEETGKQALDKERNSDILCEELASASSLVITTTLENMNIPHLLKNYLDQVVKKYRIYRKRVGKNAFPDSRKKILVISCSEGIYSHGIDKKNNFLSPYLAAIFTVMGIKDIRFVNASGLSLGDKAKEESIIQAKAELQNLAADWK